MTRKPAAAPVPWRTNARGGSAGKEHPSREDAYAEVDRLRAAFRRGARSIRTVRVYRGSELVELVSFDREAALASRPLAAVDRATASRDSAEQEAAAILARADEAWRGALFAAADAGEDSADIARAARIPLARLRRILAGPRPGRSGTSRGGTGGS